MDVCLRPRVEQSLIMKLLWKIGPQGPLFPFKTKSEALTKVLQEVGAAAYQQVAQERAKGEQSAAGKPQG